MQSLHPGVISQCSCLVYLVHVHELTIQKIFPVMNYELWSKATVQSVSITALSPMVSNYWFAWLSLYPFLLINVKQIKFTHPLLLPWKNWTSISAQPHSPCLFRNCFLVFIRSWQRDVMTWCFCYDPLSQGGFYHQAPKPSENTESSRNPAWRLSAWRQRDGFRNRLHNIISRCDKF